MKLTLLKTISLIAGVAALSASSVRGADPLPSWNDGTTKHAIAAFGNSDGDLQMLQWTGAGKGARLCLYVHHTDTEREWAYDRQSSIGRLNLGLDEANARGWTVVDMKNDWKRIWPAQNP